jgi:flagellar hook-associated protein 2
MGLSSPGIGSGLDVKGMVDAMVKADIAPLQQRHDKKLNSVNTDLSAIGQLKSSLSSLQTTVSNLTNISQFYKMKSSISESGYFSATVTDQAKSGVYQVQVQTLAQSQSLASNYFASNTTSIGSGNITINFGTYSSDLSTFTANIQASPVSITIAPGNDSLTAVCDAINASGSEIRASIVQDSLGSRLSITSVQTGESYAMQITGDIAALNYDPTTSNTALTQTMSAQNSLVKINGMILNQSSNHLKNALTGISLDLKQADLGKTINLSIENNEEQLTNSVNDFVKKYNACMTLLNNATSYNKETKQSGYFQGDSQIKNIKASLYQIVANSMQINSGSVQSLADLGLKTTKQGLLNIDQEKFDAVVADNYSSIGAIFAKTVKATDPNIQINSIDTKAKAGTYDVILSEYTPGTSITGTIGGLYTTSSDGMTLKGSGALSSLSINVLSGSIGDRGQIIVEDGLAAVMNSVLETYIGKNGEFDQRTESLNNEATQLAKTQEKIDERSEMLEKRYLKQWSAVDLLLSQLQSTSTELTQLLDNLPKYKVKS